MRRVIGSLLLVLVLSSLIAASSIFVGFTIKDNKENKIETLDTSENSNFNYGFYLTGFLLTFIGGLVVLKLRSKKTIKNISSKKKHLAKRSPIKKK